MRRRLCARGRAQTVVEYAVVIGLLMVFGKKVRDTFSSTNTTITSTDAGTGDVAEEESAGDESGDDGEGGDEDEGGGKGVGKGGKGHGKWSSD